MTCVETYAVKCAMKSLISKQRIYGENSKNNKRMLFEIENGTANERL